MKAVLLALFAQDPTPAPPVQVDLRISPIVDLWFQARTHAATHQDLVEEHPLAPLVRAMRDFEAGFGSARGFGVIEGNLLDCETAKDVAAALADVPVTMSIRAPGGSRRVPVRALAQPIIEALIDAAPEWTMDFTGAEPFPDTRYADHFGDATQARLDFLLLNETTLYPELLAWLGMAFDAPLEIPVYLVGNAPSPGAHTVRTHGGGAVCFVGLRQVPAGPGMLHEVVVHETIHALDVLSAERKTLLSEVRDELLANGLEARSAHYRSVPHTLFFLAAAEAVRRHGPTDHEDYGDVAEYYAKVADVIDVERGLWKAYVAGELERAELIARIVKAFAPRGR